MTLRLGINGFGRIGRTILRQVLAGTHDIAVVHINDIASPELCAHLFAYDSVFGPFQGTVEARDGALVVDGQAIPISQSTDLDGLDVSDVDLWLECAGHAKTREVAERGLRAGAPLVLISGPTEAADVTVIAGANDADLGTAQIVSNGSCTTNALAPLMARLDQSFGLDAAHMTTIHCYTASQPMMDAPRGDFARSRAGALSMVPTTTSATELVRQVLPHLADRLTGAAVRVPVPSVSAVDVVVTLGKAVSPRAVHDAVIDGHLIGAVDGPLVSSDLRARPESLILARPETMQPAPNVIRLFGWYDNEWGFSARMIDMARRMVERPSPTISP